MRVMAKWCGNLQIHATARCDFTFQERRKASVYLFFEFVLTIQKHNLNSIKDICTDSVTRKFWSSHK